MPGKIKNAIDTIVSERSQGNPTLASTTRTKLMLKGINPAIYSTASPDDPSVLAKLKLVAHELGIQISI